MNKTYERENADIRETDILKDGLLKLFDEYHTEKDTKEEDGSRTITLRNGADGHMTLNFDAKEKRLTLVCPDTIPIDEVERYTGSHFKKLKQHRSLWFMLGSADSTEEYSVKPDKLAVLKYVFIPFLYCFMLVYLGGSPLIAIVIMVLMLLASCVYLCPYILLSSVLSEKVKGCLWRLPMSVGLALPFFVFLFFSVTERIIDPYESYLQLVLYFTSPIFLYPYYLPALAADHYMTGKHDIITKKKERTSSKVLYHLFVMVMTGLLLFFTQAALSGLRTQEEDRRAALREEEMYRVTAEVYPAEEEYIEDTMGQELTLIMLYAEKYSCYDFLYCPDERLEDAWNRVFADENIKTDTYFDTDKGEISATLRYNNRNYTVSVKDGIVRISKGTTERELGRRGQEQ